MKNQLEFNFAEEVSKQTRPASSGESQVRVLNSAPLKDKNKQNILFLEVCSRNNSIYQEIRNRHYVDNRGTHGQQIHFLINYCNKYCGIISGASSVYGVKARDVFFQIPKNQHIKQKFYLPAIINNTVFRLENHEKNLGTKILKLWRNTIADLWEKIYKIPVIGFETFIIETNYRKGCMYKADNWVYCGITSGSTKTHQGMSTPAQRIKTTQKLIYCKWHNKTIPTTPYEGCWKMKTHKEKTRARELSNLKKSILATKYYYEN